MRAFGPVGGLGNSYVDDRSWLGDNETVVRWSRARIKWQYADSRVLRGTRTMVVLTNQRVVALPPPRRMRRHSDWVLLINVPLALVQAEPVDAFRPGRFSYWRVARPLLRLDAVVNERPVSIGAAVDEPEGWSRDIDRLRADLSNS